ncbi:mechanosensitive ion channel family protein [Flagellimonas beolgyonensis]|uniref:mechanosensitive ion channel family protein n=1 Tax=Flagellimonas beolgyonensis TaxID=864064 RepID=UPI003D658A26
MQEKLFGEFRTATIIVIILVATVLLALLFNWVTKRYIRRSLLLHGRDLTSFQFFRHIVSALIYMVGLAAALTQVPEFKIVGHSLLAGAGVISLVAGLASQQALSNIMSGILIVIFKPFRLNDKITLRGTFTGVVEDINLRQVVIRDAENNRIIIPNSVISSDLIVNSHMSDSRCCKLIEIGISYSSDMERALEIMRQEVIRHPLRVDSRTPEDIQKQAPEVVARVISLGDSSINLRVWAWAANPADAFVMSCDLLQSIKNAFDREGIEIPFPQREVHLKTGLEGTKSQ